MGQTESSHEEDNYDVHNDELNLRRQKSLFFPLGENRRLKRIDYLLISSDMYVRGIGEQNKDIDEKRKELKTTSTANVELMEEAFKEYDFNFNKAGSNKVIKIDINMSQKFDAYLDDLFSNPTTQGFIIYYTGQITEQKQQLVFSDDKGEAVLYDFQFIIQRWRKVPNYEKKNLLIIIDADNCGSYLGLKKKTEELEAYEDYFGFEGHEKPQFVLRKEPTVSIIASEQKKNKDNELYKGESPNNNFQSDFKNKQDMNSKGSNFGEASRPPAGRDKTVDQSSRPLAGRDASMEKYQKASSFTAIFSEYLKSCPPDRIEHIAKVKCFDPKNDNEPCFFGCEVKAYHDFGIFPWVKYIKMKNQLELNCYVSLGLQIKKEQQQNFNNSKIGKFCTINLPQQNQNQSSIQNPSDSTVANNLMSPQKSQNQLHPTDSVIAHNLTSPNKSVQNMSASYSDDPFKQLESKLLQNCEKGEYFGFVAKNLKDLKFGNPQFSRPASNVRSQNIGSNNNLDVLYTSNHVSSLTHMDDLRQSSFHSNNAFRSTILRGNQNMDEGTVIRKYYGMQEYKKDKNDEQFTELYEGMWADDKFSNFGSYYHSNGDRFEGLYKAGKKEGYGVYYFNNGDIYAGNFSENQISGFGKIMYKNGGVYIGNFKKGKREGFGILCQLHEKATLVSHGHWLENEQWSKLVEAGDSKDKVSTSTIYILSLPEIQMLAQFEGGQISGVVWYVIRPALHENQATKKAETSIESLEKIVFSSKWKDNRRIEDIHYLPNQCKNTQLNQSQAESKYMSLIKKMENLYQNFIPPTVKI